MRRVTRDRLSVEDRSQLMGRVRQRDTAPETALGRAMWARGLRYRKSREISGTRPDFSIASKRIAIFVDGCFWHGCPDHYVAPVGNADFWATKLSKNRERDTRDNLALREAGWIVLRFWECQINTRRHDAVDAVVQAVRRGDGAQ